MTNQLPNFLNYVFLNQLREQMGAPLVEYSSGHKPNYLTKAELEELASRGLDIDIKDVRFLPDGTAAYKDSRILIHIRDINSYMGYDPSLPKFHFSDCTTIQKMRNNDRIERYVASTRRDGKFNITYMNRMPPQSELRELLVCKYCLSKISYKGYSTFGRQKEAIFGAFALDEYFKVYPQNYLMTQPRYTDLTAPQNIYSSDWPIISRKIRQSRGWKCESCGGDYGKVEYQKFLDVHHKDGMKNNNSPENLMALCKKCHADEFQHAHIKNSPGFREHQAILQNIPKPIS